MEVAVAFCNFNIGPFDVKICAFFNDVLAVFWNGLNTRYMCVIEFSVGGTHHRVVHFKFVSMKWNVFFDFHFPPEIGHVRS